MEQGTVRKLIFSNVGDCLRKRQCLCGVVHFLKGFLTNPGGDRIPATRPFFKFPEVFTPG
jgi:hypothetical protein